MTTREIWNRSYVVRMDDLVFDSRTGETLYMDFEVTKTLYVQANTGSLTLYNLNQSHRTRLAQFRQNRRRIRMEIRAGYGNDPPLLFIGDVRPVGFEDYGDGTETTTKVSGTDGGPKITETRFSRTYPEGTDLRIPVRDLARSLSIGDGNLSEIGTLSLGSYTALPRPLTVSGLASTELTELLRGAGYTWSIQNGAIQILRNGATLNRTGVSLSPSTGLVSAAYVDRRTVKVISHLIPEVAPGYSINVESERVTGAFRVHSVKYAGQTDGEWSCEIECRIPRAIVPY